MNWKDYRRGRSWPNLGCYFSNLTEGLRKTTKNLSEGNRSLGQDLQWVSPATVNNSTAMFVQCSGSYVEEIYVEELQFDLQLVSHFLSRCLSDMIPGCASRCHCNSSSQSLFFPATPLIEPTI
jgi:hypothetical protein